MVQIDPYPESQTFHEFITFSDCLDAIIEWYEDNLRTRTNNPGPVHYTPKEVFEFIDTYYLVTCLVLDKESGCYTANYKEWLKEQIFNEIRLRECFTVLKKPPYGQPTKNT